VDGGGYERVKDNMGRTSKSSLLLGGEEECTFKILIRRENGMNEKNRFSFFFSLMPPTR
jgi:hypothetical protein